VVSVITNTATYRGLPLLLIEQGTKLVNCHVHVSSCEIMVISKSQLSYQCTQEIMHYHIALNLTVNQLNPFILPTFTDMIYRHLGSLNTAYSFLVHQQNKNNAYSICT